MIALKILARTADSASIKSTLTSASANQASKVMIAKSTLMNAHQTLARMMDSALMASTATLAHAQLDLKEKTARSTSTSANRRTRSYTLA
jgi:hypothetical protein